MDKFKNLVHSRDNQEPEATPASSGRLTGQGSHFPKQEEHFAADATGLQANTAGGYVPGTDVKQLSEPAPTSGLTATPSGTAAIGETSTYSSHALPQGDSVGGVVDPSSHDPTTYQMPEHSYTSSRGIPEGGPLAAAAAAFHKDKDYSTSHLPGAYPQESAYDSATVAENPADRSAIYGQAQSSRVPDASAAAQSALGGSAANREPVADEPKQTSTVGKILGAVGLGTAAAGAGVAASKVRSDAIPPAVGRPDQPTTTTGVDSYTAPTQSVPTQSNSLYSPPAPRHHRKESIPTTAYPAGVDSPSPISAPVGGTMATPGREHDDHTRRNIGLAAAGVGAGAIGAHEYDRNRALPDSTTRLPREAVNTQTTPSSGMPVGATQDNSAFRRDIQPAPGATTMEPDRDSHGYGKTATVAGLGAAAGTAGAYSLQSREPETNRSDWPLRDDSTTIPTASTVATSQRAVESQPAAFPTQQQETFAHGNQSTEDRNTTGAPYTDRQSRYEEPSQKSTARQEAALAASAVPERDEQQIMAEDEAERRRRREKEAALAGVAGAGAGAAGLYEHDKHQHEEDEARRQKDLAEQEEARRRQYEKDEKTAKKDAKKEEKLRAKEEKAVAKEEKKQQKEIEKEEKRQQKELEKDSKLHDKAATVEYENQSKLAHEEREDRERREKEAAAATGLGAAGTAAYAVHDKDKHPPPTTATDDSGRTKLHKDPPEEKKPGLLKRIFRRRKNKDTGEEEEYEDEEGNGHEPESEHSDHRLAAAGIGAGTGAGVAGTPDPTSHERPADSYEAQSGGVQKPSYNPFSKDDPSSVAGLPGTSASAHPPASSAYTEDSDRQHGLAGAGTTDPTRHDPPYDPPHDPSSRQVTSQQGERIDNIGGITAGHPYAEGEPKPSLGHRLIDSLKPLPEREQLQQHSEEYHSGGTGSHTHGTAQ